MVTKLKAIELIIRLEEKEKIILLMDKFLKDEKIIINIHLEYFIVYWKFIKNMKSCKGN